LKSFGIDPNQAIALQDSINGAKAAEAAGIFYVAISLRITKDVPIEQANVVLDSPLSISSEDLKTLVQDG